MISKRQKTTFRNTIVMGRFKIDDVVERWRSLDPVAARIWLARLSDYVMRNVLIPSFAGGPGYIPVGIALSTASDLHHRVGMGVDVSDLEWRHVLHAVAMARRIHGVARPDPRSARASDRPGMMLALVCCQYAAELDLVRLSDVFELAAEAVSRSPQTSEDPGIRAHRAYQSMLKQMELTGPIRMHPIPASA